MRRQLIKCENKEQWLQERLKDITSTEISALFNASPYLTELELYFQKKTQTCVEIDDNNRMWWGRKLESAIAEGTAEKNGWSINKLNDYIRLEGLRIGSSFDFEVIDGENVGIMEIKNIDFMSYKRSWISQDGSIEAPLHIELQLQHQLLVSGRSWGVIVALIGGNDLKVVRRDRDEQICNAILQKCKLFWDRIDNNTAPEPDYVRDTEIIAKMAGTLDNDVVLRADEELSSLINTYVEVTSKLSDLDEKKTELKNRILEKAGPATCIVSDTAKVNCALVKASNGTIITEDMVGKQINARKAFRNFRVTAA